MKEFNLETDSLMRSSAEEINVDMQQYGYDSRGSELQYTDSAAEAGGHGLDSRDQQLHPSDLIADHTASMLHSQAIGEINSFFNEHKKVVKLRKEYLQKKRELLSNKNMKKIAKHYLEQARKKKAAAAAAGKAPEGRNLEKPNLVGKKIALDERSLRQEASLQGGGAYGSRRRNKIRPDDNDVVIGIPVD